MPGKPKGLPKTGGRKKGSLNKVTPEFRETVKNLLAKNEANVSKWLDQVADTDPGKALDLLAKLAEYAAPKLARTEHVGDAKQPMRVEFGWANKPSE